MELLEESAEERPDRIWYFPEFDCRNLRECDSRPQVQPFTSWKWILRATVYITWPVILRHWRDWRSVP